MGIEYARRGEIWATRHPVNLTPEERLDFAAYLMLAQLLAVVCGGLVPFTIVFAFTRVIACWGQP